MSGSFFTNFAALAHSAAVNAWKWELSLARSLINDILHHKPWWLWKTELFYHASFGPVMIDILATQRDALATQVVILIDKYKFTSYATSY